MLIYQILVIIKIGYLLFYLLQVMETNYHLLWYLKGLIDKIKEKKLQEVEEIKKKFLYVTNLIYGYYRNFY